jgi:hypothetical protein
LMLTYDYDYEGVRSVFVRGRMVRSCWRYWTARQRVIEAGNVTMDLGNVKARARLLPVGTSP